MFQRLGLPSPSSISKWTSLGSLPSGSQGRECGRFSNGHGPSASRFLLTRSIASAARSSSAPRALRR